MKHKFRFHTRWLDLRKGEFDIGFMVGKLHSTFVLCLSLIFVQFVVFYE